MDVINYNFVIIMVNMFRVAANALIKIFEISFV